MIEHQLTGLYDQTALVPMEIAPPLGFKPFRPRFRTALLPLFHRIRELDPKDAKIFKEVHSRSTLRALICPSCFHPRFKEDEWGWIWIVDDHQLPMEQGNISECFVCNCLVWSTNFLTYTDAHYQVPAPSVRNITYTLRPRI